VWLTFSYFILRTQAACAKIKSFRFSIDNENDRMDIRQPFTLGMALGMADIMPELWYFTT
jgi:hypothetical protein